MKQFFVLVSVTVLMSACHSNSAPAAGTTDPDSAKRNYLPVADYLQAEIAQVDSFPMKIVRYHTVNGKTDSAIISTQTFDSLAKQFLSPELDSSRFSRKFDESSFMDQSTERLNFTYSTKQAGFGLKRVDVLLANSNSGVEKLSSVYMESLEGNSDTTLLSKLSWKAGRNFSILQIRQPKNGPEKIIQTRVVWDTRD